MVERWSPIPGYDGYDASTLGCVRSWRSKRRRPGRIVRAETPVVLIPQTDGRGRLRVTLCRDGQRPRREFVSRLVLMAFSGPCPENCEACHDPDPTPSNCALDNLRWDTRANNYADKARQGRPQVGNHSPNHLLTEAKVRLARFLNVVHSASSYDIAAWFDAHQSTVFLALSGKTWVSVPMQVRGESADLSYGLLSLMEQPSV